MSRLQANLLLLAVAAIWGTAFLFQKSAMSVMGPLYFIFARSLLGCLALLPLAALEHRRLNQPVPAAVWRIALMAGVLFFAGAALQQTGIVTASVTNTGFLTGLYVVFTPLISWLVLSKTPAAIVWPAVALSVAGTWCLGGASIAAIGHGDLLVLASAVFWAAHVVLLGVAAKCDRPALINAVQFAVVALIGLAGAFAFESPNFASLRAAAIDIAFVGILSSAVTFTLFTIALRHTSATEAAVIVSSETLIAALAAYFVLGERLTVIGALGAALILAAILIVQLVPQRVASPEGAVKPSK